MVDVTRSNFEAEVINSDKPVLLDIWAEWCGPCRVIAPAIEAIAESRSDIKVGKVNVVDYADVPSAPSAPNMTKNCVIGFLIGAFVVAAIIILRLFSDTVLHDSSDIQKTTELSILGSVPSLKVKGKKETPFTIVKGRNIANEK